jgi:trimeric autotransporter adhesin
MTTNISRRAALSAAAILSAFIASSGQTQVRIAEPGEPVPDRQFICRDDTGAIYAAPGGFACDDSYLRTDGGRQGIYIGPNDEIVFDGPSGAATFNGSTTFNGSATFNGSTSINGGLSLTGSINAAGITSSGGMTNTGTFTNNGSATVIGGLTANAITAASGQINGLLTTNALTTGNINAATLSTTGGATVQGFLNVGNGASILGTTQLATAQIFQALNISNGAAVNMGGNRVQNVAAGTASTDAVNVGQLNAAVTGVGAAAAAAQTTANTALANAATAQASANMALAQNVVQDTRLTAVEAINTTQDNRLTAAELLNTAQSNQISALEAATQSLGSQIALNQEQANGGIATAMALGGMMVVPDSSVTVNFNLATYRGEQGFAGGIVARLGPRVYINAGVAGSTVRGSTGGRVGIAFGL